MVMLTIDRVSNSMGVPKQEVERLKAIIDKQEKQIKEMNTKC